MAELSKKALARRRRNAARKAAALTKESSAGSVSVPDLREKATQSGNDTKFETNGNSSAKSGDDITSASKTAIALDASKSNEIPTATKSPQETREVDDVVQVESEVFTASSSHSSSTMASRVDTPTSSKSWASICSAPIASSAIVSEPLLERANKIDTMTPAQQSSVSSDSAKVARSTASPPTIRELDDFIHSSRSRVDVTTGHSTSTDQDEKTTRELSMSYAKATHAAPSNTAKSIETDADVLPQPNVTSSLPVTPEFDAVVEQLVDNLYVMTRPERLNLLSGPLITIEIGDVKVTGIYKRLAMASCSVLSKYFAKFPEALEYRFERGSIDPGAVRYLLVTWAKEMSQAFEINTIPMQGSFAKDVALLRASRLLGMERYTKNMLSTYIRYLKECIPSYREVGIVEKNATTEKDPLWTHMVNHLCHDRHKKLIPDPEHFAEFLEEHPRLKGAMEKADAYFAGVAQQKFEEKKAVWEAEEAERRERWEQKEKEKRERIAKEKESASSLKKKMDAKGGSGLMMATVEEAALLRSR